MNNIESSLAERLQEDQRCFYVVIVQVKLLWMSFSATVLTWLRLNNVVFVKTDNRSHTIHKTTVLIVMLRFEGKA